MQEKQNAEIVEVSDIKLIVALIVLLAFTGGCGSQMPVEVSAPVQQEVVKPELSATGEARLQAAKPEPMPTVKEPNQQWPKISSVGRMSSYNPFTEKDETNWIIIYQYGPGMFDHIGVTITADKLTDELVRQAITKANDQRKKQEAEESEARKQFVGKEY